MHDPGGLGKGLQGVGPVDVQDVHVVGLEIFQRCSEVPLEKVRRAIAEDLTVLPIQAGLGSNEDFIPTILLSQGLADDFLGGAKAVNRGRVNEIDTLLQSPRG